MPVDLTIQVATPTGVGHNDSALLNTLSQRYGVNFRPLNPGGTPIGAPAAQHIRIADGRNTYVFASFPDHHLVGKVLVSEP